MSEKRIAKIAVAAANYSIDKPYDYLIPDSMADLIAPGMRVTVPFSRGNRRSEGIVLAVSDNSEYESLKPIESCLDKETMLTPSQLKLALWMHDRLFCTVYDAVRTILPAGCWFKADGARQVNDKMREMISLAIDAEEAFDTAQNIRRKAPMQAALLELMCSTGRVSAREAMHFTGASRQSLNALINAQLVVADKEEVFRRPEVWTGKLKALPELNREQKIAYSGIKKLLDEPCPEAALLCGVTGSGKTSVYIRLIDDTIKSGKCAILLVPEIALTPQMIHTFSEYFGNDVAILHSSLAVGERYDEWKRIKTGGAKLAIGTRSAVFAPFENLGLIIIDEEQEDSYKSENSPRYHARDVAKYRCAKTNSLLLLGSATPDIESRYAAESGKYKLFRMNERYNAMQLPSVEIVDMKSELKSGNGSELSSRLKAELEELDRQKGELIDEICAMAECRQELKLCADRMDTKVAYAEAEGRLYGMESVVALQGWVLARKVPELEASLEKFDCAWELCDPEPEEYPDVPVQLRNNKITNALNMVTNMYSLPSYDGVDPNPLMAPFFILFYGLMMADMGYGLIMILAAVVAMKKMHPRKGSLSFCQLLLYSGISTFIMGILTGGFFGDALAQIGKILGKPDGWGELWGIADRTDYDLTQHQNVSGQDMTYFDPEKNESYVPYDVETSIGVDRMFLSVMCHSYCEEKLENGETRVVLRLPEALAPVKCAVFPLDKKYGLPELAHEIVDELKFHFNTHYGDPKDSIGKRYRRQDAIGTPFCITVDHETPNDHKVTLRYRDTMEQERVAISDLRSIIEERVSITSVLKKLGKEIKNF